MAINHSIPTALLMLSSLAPGAASAQVGVSFSHLDWEIACDNTLTCRAAGYHAGDQETGVSVLLTRAAGPDQPVAAQVQLAHYDEAATPLPTQVQMTVDHRALGSVKLAKDSATGTLTPAQTAALLSAALGKSTIAWSAGNRSWQLSGNGANAVLLKMDEVQGRLGTPGALVRKGSRPEAEVLPPLPAPVIAAAAVPKVDPSRAVLAPAERKTLLAELVKTGAGKDCERFADIRKGEAELGVYRLANDKLLVEAQCWLAAYNGGSAFWTANVRSPYAPRLLKVDANAYENGRLLSEQKGRGLGDCWSHAEWVWDGKQFVQSAAYDTGMCRLIAPGGAWTLPTLVTTVKQTH
jgi:hypothetical protein